MIHMKDRLLVTSQLIDFRRLIMHPAVVFFLLTHSGGGSVSSPDVRISKVSNGLVLQCESAGWHPEPEVLWLDGEGKLLSPGPTETVRGPDDLYTVSSRVTVEKRHGNSFTCRVQQRNINQTRETHIQVPEYLFMAQSNAARIIICLIVCILSVVAVVFIVWKMGQIEKKTSDGSTELQHLMGGEFREKLMTGRDNAKAKLDEELQKNKGELQHVQQVITTLMGQKEDLKNQREKLISLLREDNAEKEENEKDQENIGFMEKKTEKKKKLEKIKDDVEKRMKEHGDLLKKTQTLLKITKEMNIQMSERKEKLQANREQINENLTEREKQRELQSEQPEREEERKDTVSADQS